MPVQVVSLVNVVQSIDGQDLPPYGYQMRDALTTDIIAARDLRKLYYNVLDGVPPPNASSVIAVDGANFLILPDGSLMPLEIMAGTPQEPLVAGVVQQKVSIDHGSDADHVEILYTFNATTGDPDTPSTALASARFTSPDGNAEVVKTEIIGASAGSTKGYFAAGGITCIHFGLRGAGPYTVAAANVLTALQMVVMKWPDSLNVRAVEVAIGTSTVGAGSNRRYRTITVTGYSS